MTDLVTHTSSFSNWFIHSFIHSLRNWFVIVVFIVVPTPCPPPHLQQQQQQQQNNVVSSVQIVSFVFFLTIAGSNCKWRRSLDARRVKTTTTTTWHYQHLIVYLSPRDLNNNTKRKKKNNNYSIVVVVQSSSPIFPLLKCDDYMRNRCCETHGNDDDDANIIAKS